MSHEEKMVTPKRTPKRVTKPKRVLSPEDIETRYQAHLAKIGGGK